MNLLLFGVETFFLPLICLVQIQCDNFYFILGFLLLYFNMIIIHYKPVISYCETEREWIQKGQEVESN